MNMKTLTDLTAIQTTWQSMPIAARAAAMDRFNRIVETGNAEDKEATIVLIKILKGPKP